MKRFLAFAVLICLLLSGCGLAGSADATPTPDTAPTPTPTQALTPTPVPTPTPTPTPAPKVTVYLLERTAYYDSGYIEYYYDDDYNIDCYAMYSIEQEHMYSAYFENKDSNGMAARFRTQWPDSDYGEARSLTRFPDGRLKEELYEGSNFSGYQYEYDNRGLLTEKREYYDGILQTVVYFEYNDDELRIVYCEDSSGLRMFDCDVENGRIVEKTCYDSGNPYSYFYKYDANGNMVESTMVYEGETLPGDYLTYKAVEVDANRVPYLLEQQKYLFTIY